MAKRKKHKKKPRGTSRATPKARKKVKDSKNDTPGKDRNTVFCSFRDKMLQNLLGKLKKMQDGFVKDIGKSIDWVKAGKYFDIGSSCNDLGQHKKAIEAHKQASSFWTEYLKMKHKTQQFAMLEGNRPAQLYIEEMEKVGCITKTDNIGTILPENPFQLLPTLHCVV